MTPSRGLDARLDLPLEDAAAWPGWCRSVLTKAGHLALELLVTADYASVWFREPMDKGRGKNSPQREECLSPKSTVTRNQTLTMEVTFHDRNHDVPAEEVRYALRKLDSVVGQFDLVARAEVEFDRDLKKRATPLYVVKVNLHLIGHRLSDLHAEETGRELRTTVDLVIDKIGGEVATLKDRITAHP